MTPHENHPPVTWRSPLLRVLALLALLASPATAQVPEPVVPPQRTASFTLGGLQIDDSRLLLGKVGFEVGHFALSADFTVDEVIEDRQDDSEDLYRLYAAGLTARIYSEAPGRGFFGEVGGGWGSASLRTTDEDGTRRERDGSLPFLTWGGGFRLGVLSDVLFVEAGLRTALYLKEVHLYTSDSPPPGSRDEALNPGSWFFGRGDRSSQIYLGVGFTF